ncbi:hypothetical protein E2I00_005744, partial [Balaenoptera physalus]
MPPPRGDVTVLFLGPPGSGKSALIAALCDKDVETVEIPDGRPDSGLPSLRAAGPGLFLGELSCPPAAPGPWAAEANMLESQHVAQARDHTAARLDSAGLGAAALFVLQTDCRSSDGCEELERLRAALRSQAEALQRLLPPAQDGFEVLGAAELEAVREAFETGGLEAALSWVRAGLERLGSARLDLAVAGRADVSFVLNMLLGLDPDDPGAVPASAPAEPMPYPAPERPNSLDEEEKSGEGLENAGGGGFENARSEGREKRGPGSQKAGSGEGSEDAGSESLKPVGVGVKKPGSGDLERAAALSPEDE